MGVEPLSLSNNTFVMVSNKQWRNDSTHFLKLSFFLFPSLTVVSNKPLDCMPPACCCAKNVSGVAQRFYLKFLIAH